MIRLATPADAATIAAIYRPHVLEGTATFEEVPPDAAEMADRMRRIQTRYPYLVAVEDGEISGYAYACAHRERVCYRYSVDTAVYIREDRHRRGLGRHLYGVLLPLLTRLDYHTAYAGITEDNLASLRMHEALGFTTIGIYSEVGAKFGRWLGVRWLSLRLNPATVPPREPQVFSADLLDG